MSPAGVAASVPKLIHAASIRIFPCAARCIKRVRIERLFGFTHARAEPLLRKIAAWRSTFTENK